MAWASRDDASLVSCGTRFVQPLRTSAVPGQIPDRAAELAARDDGLKKRFNVRDIEDRREYDPDLLRVHWVTTGVRQVILNLPADAAH
jgi:hypothetical protein